MDHIELIGSGSNFYLIEYKWIKFTGETKITQVVVLAESKLEALKKLNNAYNKTPGFKIIKIKRMVVEK